MGIQASVVSLRLLYIWRFSSYGKRLGIIEPVFGNIKACKRMDRFTLRSRIKVNIQWMLYCLVHNIEKIINFGKSYAMAAAY
jgi:hypothetical protein